MMNINDAKTITNTFLDEMEEKTKNGETSIAITKDTLTALKKVYAYFGYKPGKKDTDYPSNLFSLITGREETPNEEQANALEDVMQELTERERRILHLRFKEGLTLEETGNCFGVTRERIRQTQDKAIRRLSFPSRLRVITEGKAAITEHDEALSAYRKETAKYHAMVKKLMEKEACLEELLSKKEPLDLAEKEKAREIIGTENLDMSIEEMELSVRTFACLKRAGKEKAKDFIGMKYNDFLKIRNLGRKSAEEIIGVLKSLGISIESDEE